MTQVFHISCENLSYFISLSRISLCIIWLQSPRDSFSGLDNYLCFICSQWQGAGTKIETKQGGFYWLKFMCQDRMTYLQDKLLSSVDCCKSLGQTEHCTYRCSRMMTMTLKRDTSHYSRNTFKYLYLLMEAWNVHFLGSWFCLQSL